MYELLKVANSKKLVKFLKIQSSRVASHFYSIKIKVM